ncbi:hypothetical protein LptCag_1677 [Leptospirillum ferriphilum]|uniref:Uncharacterized protein n=1 Tax=Leptospirillum ferriphilum TaxID=178606 RepID=A0A094W5U6_9BACT|nr:hypothetical protein LptCag_1677 [Leptospirillum ferriphilum]
MDRNVIFLKSESIHIFMSLYQFFFGTKLPCFFRQRSSLLHHQLSPVPVNGTDCFIAGRQERLFSGGELTDVRARSYLFDPHKFGWFILQNRTVDSRFCKSIVCTSCMTLP